MKSFFSVRIWEADPAKRGRLGRIWLNALRLSYAVSLDIKEKGITLRAMSLVYTTLLSIVPLLAVVFSVLKAFNLHSNMEIFLYYFLEPIGERGINLALRVIEMVENVESGILGSLGFSLFMYSAITLMRKLDDSINHIWRTSASKGLAKRLNDYTSALLVMPILISISISATASVLKGSLLRSLISSESLEAVVSSAGRVVPYIVMCTAFTFLYILLPAKKVRFRPALVGGLFASILWQSAGWAFASFVVTSSKYSAVYSGFAALILFVIWLYWSWLIILTGSSVSYYMQHSVLLRARVHPSSLNEDIKEKLALVVMLLIGQRYHKGDAAWTTNELSRHLGIPVETVDDIMTGLERKGLLAQVNGPDISYVPSRDMEAIPVSHIIDSVKRPAVQGVVLSGAHSLSAVDDIVKRVDEAVGGVLEGVSLKNLVLDSLEPSDSPGGE